MKSFAIGVIVILGVAASAAAQPDAEPAGCQATVAIDLEATPKRFSPLIFGGFLEHFDRQIYGGVFDPGSSLADTQGFRTDVIEALNSGDLLGGTRTQRGNGPLPVPSRREAS